MCLCWHSYLCWRFILVCVKMIVAPWILKCTSTWLKTFEHASCSHPIAISLCIDCWGLFHACSFIFEHFYQEFGCCVFFFRCLSVFPCRYWVRWARLLVFIICDPIGIPRTIVCHAKIEKSCFLQCTAKIRSSFAAFVVLFFPDKLHKQTRVDHDIVMFWWWSSSFSVRCCRVRLGCLILLLWYHIFIDIK